MQQYEQVGCIELVNNVGKFKRLNVKNPFDDEITGTQNDHMIDRWYIQVQLSMIEHRSLKIKSILVLALHCSLDGNRSRPACSTSIRA